MKRLLVVLLALGACASYAAGVPSPSTPKLMVDDNGNTLNDTYPVPVKMISTGSAAIPVNATLSTDSINLINTIASITARLLSGVNVATMPAITVPPGTYTPALEAGSETIGLFWDSPLATPTITTVESGTTATITNAAKRAYIIIQNQGATETVYVYAGATATPGESIAVYAGGSITRPWGSDVQVSYAASTTTQIVIDQEVRP